MTPNQPRNIHELFREIGRGKSKNRAGVGGAGPNPDFPRSYKDLSINSCFEMSLNQSRNIHELIREIGRRKSKNRAGVGGTGPNPDFARSYKDLSINSCFEMSQNQPRNIHELIREIGRSERAGVKFRDPTWKIPEKSKNMSGVKFTTWACRKNVGDGDVTYPCRVLGGCWGGVVTFT